MRWDFGYSVLNIFCVVLPWQNNILIIEVWTFFCLYVVWPLKIRFLIVVPQKICILIYMVWRMKVTNSVQLASFDVSNLVRFFGNSKFRGNSHWNFKGGKLVILHICKVLRSLYIEWQTSGHLDFFPFFFRCLNTPAVSFDII